MPTSKSTCDQSHGVPTEMVEDNKALFRRILEDFVTQFQFDLPELLAAAPAAATPALAP